MDPRHYLQRHDAHMDVDETGNFAEHRQIRNNMLLRRDNSLSSISSTPKPISRQSSFVQGYTRPGGNPLVRRKSSLSSVTTISRPLSPPLTVETEFGDDSESALEDPQLLANRDANVQAWLSQNSSFSPINTDSTPVSRQPSFTSDRNRKQRNGAEQGRLRNLRGNAGLQRDSSFSTVTTASRPPSRLSTICSDVDTYPPSPTLTMTSRQSTPSTPVFPSFSDTLTGHSQYLQQGKPQEAPTADPSLQRHPYQVYPGGYRTSILEEREVKTPDETTKMQLAAPFPLSSDGPSSFLEQNDADITVLDLLLGLFFTDKNGRNGIRMWEWLDTMHSAQELFPDAHDPIALEWLEVSFLGEIVIQFRWLGYSACPEDWALRINVIKEFGPYGPVMMTQGEVITQVIRRFHFLCTSGQTKSDVTRRNVLAFEPCNTAFLSTKPKGSQDGYKCRNFKNVVLKSIRYCEGTTFEACIFASV
ncbi:hypothetical protein JR316_0001490 [Psilocybe cubensis]|uniref:Uncharacterized protein n=2 Tax=Psilocybe cubensis TaxID=181762 RepID=A0ACB8HJB5_PSICU|nr:hypothetical protein JR316_0001490 [Psilocybe cubensis]KAH9487415.1 hypothetical protein JR316_0001490 [Psilocybe cubensis]